MPVSCCWTWAKGPLILLYPDGITEDIITELSRSSDLTVIAWNTSSTYKGSALQPAAVGRDLGAAFVLDGSVHKSGDRLRITAQLVDVSDGRHAWAERYDRKLTEVFAVQDEVTAEIVDTLSVTLSATEGDRLGQAGTRNIAAYDVFLRGLRLLSSTFPIKDPAEMNALLADLRKAGLPE